MPITIHHLKLFKLLLAILTTSNFDSLMIWAAMTFAFFGFLRLGELTRNSKLNKIYTLQTIALLSHPGLEQKALNLRLFT